MSTDFGVKRKKQQIFPVFTYIREHGYSNGMTLYENWVVFPDGENREITHCIGIGDIVDINGYPLSLPLPTNRMIAYHVAGKRMAEERGIVTTKYYLEQLNADELMAYT
jgi:hypothetical protein